MLGVLSFTAARCGAVSSLRVGSLRHDGTQPALRFAEKGGKVKDVPLRHDLELWLLECLDFAGLRQAGKDTPLFRSVDGRVRQLSERPLNRKVIWKMVKRRLTQAGLPTHLSPHGFRVKVITDLLEQGVPPQDVQYLAGHADARTTRLYDRRGRKVSRNLVERISF